MCHESNGELLMAFKLVLLDFYLRRSAFVKTVQSHSKFSKDFRPESENIF